MSADDPFDDDPFTPTFPSNPAKPPAPTAPAKRAAAVPPPSGESGVWTLADAAAFLRLSPGALRAVLKRRQAPPGVILRIGKRLRFSPSALRAWASGSSGTPADATGHGKA